MELDELKNILANAMSKGLPFALYALPKHLEAKLLVQKTAANYPVSLEEKGFVFAPFTTTEKSYFIPLSNAQTSFFKREKLTVDESSQNKNKIHLGQNQKAGYLSLVEKTVQKIKQSSLQKVVLSRRVLVEEKDASIEEIIKRFGKILHHYPSAFCYVFFHPEIGVWFGATPEKLISAERNKLTTVALAGTQLHRGSTHVKWDKKEDEEQEFVVEAIQTALAKFCKQIQISKKYTKKAGHLLHLNSDIEAIFDPQQLPAILNELHPTPAVCGLPKKEAEKYILANENYDRSYYTGYLGEVNMPKSISRKKQSRNQEHKAIQQIMPVTQLFVNLRCMQLKNQQTYLYVGGGITAESKPEKEWEETEHKMQTMLKVL